MGLARAGNFFFFFNDISSCSEMTQVRVKESHFSEAGFLAPNIWGDAKRGWDGLTAVALVAYQVFAECRHPCPSQL